jgi:hypothetical protein
MEIEYLFDESVFNKKTRKKAKKRFSYLLGKLKEEGAKKVIVANGLQNQIKDIKGSYTFLGFSYEGTCIVNWIKDGKLHREDGPAYQSYSRDNRMGETTTSEYWYEGNRCYNVHSVGVLKLGVEFNGEIILEEEKFGKNILYLKRLNQYGLMDCWYWVMNGV